MKNFILVGLMLLCANLFPQVGIDTDTPNGASILDIVSTEKGVLIPRLTSTERDSNLADNDINTVPPNGVVNTEITPGLLIFNITENAFEFWDGILWRQLFYNTSTAAGNAGAVKIIGQEGPLTLPSISLTHGGNTFGSKKEMEFTEDLIFAPAPTTSWPENEQNPWTSETIYTTSTLIPPGSTTPMGKVWRENPVLGQVHVWRLNVLIGTGPNSSGSLMAVMRNQMSGFEVVDISQIPSGSATGNVLTFYFYTIADDASLDPGRGYKILLASDTDCTVTFMDLTRISLFQD